MTLSHRIVRIALPLPRPRLFDYLAGPEARPEVGHCVRLPFGPGEKTGVIVAIDPPDALPVEKLKPILELLAEIPPLPAQWLALTQFAARYYQHPLGEVISAALPPGIRRTVKLPRDDDPWLATTAEGRAALGEAKRITKALAAVEAVQAAGARRRSQLLTDLEGDASGAIREARNKGWLEVVARAGEREPIGALTLNEAQADAVSAVNAAAGTFKPFLLFGVTGSGKTEVYLHQIAHTLAAGKQALMLVPEIGLTPQLMERVASRFPGANLVSLHSGMADGARSLGFVQALKGEADIVLGTRLSVFVPLPRLGLIVIDEEHDASFKQQDSLRYSARDLAVWRAAYEKLPIVLGSATPSLETWLHAEARRYTRLDLPLPAVADKPPSLRRIDTRRVKLDHGLSPGLIEGIRVRIERGEQSLVFLNRRGYAPVIACPQCNWISACPHCSANMVFHAADRSLRCHHCGGEGRVPHICPGCGNQDLQAFGRGTQRLEERLREHFPEARIERVDRDAVRTPAQWEEVRGRIEAREIDVLVGTQMLAKGHDFPMLTLVGIVGADAGLYAADYRAPERLFQQLMQVAGRSGRGELPGEVLVQTEFPEHPLYESLARRDYPGFAKRELAERKLAGFPPYGFHAVLRAEAPELDTAVAFLQQTRHAAEALQSPVRLFDVVPMRLVRKARLERAQLVIECDTRPGLQAMLTELMPQLYALKSPKDLRWHIDVDPGEL
ncbi:primosomal protein N' [Uliginosibacterium aquaticum]|uniref:Replication restart protein PriA n=1 Tax=Uliginosibacterium aquaticum TaxID=2731212 RepID=A0ABX2IG99_9RHOO|nr:primosomal protein N' [Uliginosibacterium aquaticum]NSL53619.1 primosomal protein N' [Uliginosibacterium aquaticum]